MPPAISILDLEEDYGFICLKFLNQMNAINVCRETVSFALASSNSEIERRDLRAFSTRLQDDGFHQIIQDPASFVTKGQHVTFAKSMTASALVNSVRTVDSATIVFAHSVLDAILIDLLNLTFKASPNDWLQFVMKRKIEFSSVVNQPVEDLAHPLVDSFIKELERESLMRKSDVLHTICKPSSTDKKMETYAFSKDKLKFFDETRHNLVHGQKFNDRVADTAEILEYAFKTCGYYMLLVNQRFGFQFSGGAPKLIERLKKSSPSCDPEGILLSFASLLHKK